MSFENLFQVRTKEWKTRSSNCKKIQFLSFSRHFNCDLTFAMIVSLLHDRVHGFNEIRNARLKNAFEMANFCQL